MLNKDISKKNLKVYDMFITTYDLKERVRVEFWGGKGGGVVWWVLREM